MLLVYINCTQIQILVAQVAPHIFFTLLANDVFLFAMYSYLSVVLLLQLVVATTTYWHYYFLLLLLLYFIFMHFIIILVLVVLVLAA